MRVEKLQTERLNTSTLRAAKSPPKEQRNPDDPVGNAPEENKQQSEAEPAGI